MLTELLPHLMAQEEIDRRTQSAPLTSDRAYALMLLAGKTEQEADQARLALQTSELKRRK